MRLSRSTIKKRFQKEHVIPLTKYHSCKKKMLFKCAKCGYIWKTKPAGIFRGKGCPHCGCLRSSMKQTISRNLVKKKLFKKHIKLISTYHGCQKKGRLKCLKCGYIWIGVISNVFHRKYPCRHCSYLIHKHKKDMIYRKRISPYFYPIDTYVNSATKLHARCKRCGHICYSTPGNLYRGDCIYCGYKHGLKRKFVNSEIKAKKYVKNSTRGKFTLLKYNGAESSKFGKSIFRHNTTHPHKFKLMYESFKRRPHCPKCHKLFIHRKKFIKYANEINYLTHGKFTLIKIKWSRHSRFYIMHNAESHCFWADGDTFKKKPVCYICSKGHRINTSIFRNKVRLWTHGKYLVLSNVNHSNEKVLMEHYSKTCKYYIKYHKFYVFKTTPNDFQRGHRCPYDNETKLKSTLSYNWDVEHRTGGTYSCLKYVADRLPAIFRHNTKKKKPHTFIMTPNNFNKGERCPYCASSHGEEIVMNYLLSYGFTKHDFSHGYRLHNTKDRKHRLHLDYYIPKYNIGIEFDGKQHFKLVNFGHESHKAQVAEYKGIHSRDRRKNKYCKDNGIHLIRIPDVTSGDTDKQLHKLVWKNMNKKFIPLIRKLSKPDVQLSLF